MTLTGVDDGDVEGNETVIIDITGVNNGTEDGAQQITATITDDDEAAPPAAPTNVSVTPGDGALTVNFTPVSGEVSYTATCTPSGGTPVTATGSGSSITVTGLTNGVSYSCSVAVTGYSGVSDAAASAAVAPAAPAPAAPTNVSVTPGDGALTVNFTPVSGETSYTATCTPSGGTPVTATGSGSSVTVTGLTNGVSYSCSVAVTGYSGVSDAAASAAVAPAAPAPASAPTPVPTLGFFAQWLVSMLLGGLGLFGLRRRKKS
jgi:titin